MKGQATKAAAAIEIGSSGVRMLISQWNGKSVEPLDCLEKPLPLGQEAFSSGYIAFETVRGLSEILTGFCRVAQEYGVSRVHATATTALREVTNQAYILDHLLIQNKLPVQILEDAETGALLFGHICRELPPGAEKTLLVYGGTGAIDLALRTGGEFTLTHSIDTGLLKMADLLQEASALTLRVDQVAREFLHTYLARQYRILSEEHVDSLLFSMGELEDLIAICEVDQSRQVAVLTKKSVASAYERCRDLSFDQFAQRYRLPHQRAGGAYAALVLLHSLVQLTGVKKARCVRSSVAEASLDMLLRPGARRAFTETLRAGAVSSARHLSERYWCNQDHVRHMTATAVTLFDKLRKLHGLSRRQGLLLQTACILHELGRFTNAANTQEATFFLVRDAQVYGLRADEMLLVANIISPQSLLGVARGARSRTLPETEMLVVAKMHALLHLADAIDHSRKQKATLRQVDLEEDGRLTISLEIREDYTLERLMFQESAALFQEIFGITPALDIAHAKQQKGLV